MTYHILWIEDNPQGAFAPYLTPILSDPGIYLELANDATAAFLYLQANPCDLIIFDLDLPPGDNDSFQVIYRFCAPAQRKIDCVLGCHLLRLWLGYEPVNFPDDIDANTLRLPTPLATDQIVVYSVYANNFRKNLNNLGLREDRIIQKDARQSRFFLHRRIKEILEKK